MPTEVAAPVSPDWGMPGPQVPSITSSMGVPGLTSAAARRDIREWPRIAVTAPLWAAYGAAVAVLSIVYFLVGADSVPQGAIYQALSLGAIGAIAVALVRHRPERRLAWLLFGAGLVLWTLGDAYWDSYSWFLHTEAPFPSVADIAYVGGYPLLIAATFVLARGARPRLTDVLDSAVVAVSALIVTWALLVEPLFAQTGLSTAGMAVTVATPVLDVLLLVGVVQLALRKGFENPALRFLVVGIVFQVVTDVAYSYLTLKGAYTNGMFVDAGWLAAYGLFGVAALHPSMAHIKPLPMSPSVRFSGKRIALLASATLCAPVVMIADSISGDPLDVIDLSVGSIAVTLLVGARLALLQRERNRMLAAVDIGREKYRELFEQADEARAALAVQNERLRELDHLKDNLISVVSHELRTPLTSILGYLELLQQDRDDQLTQRQRHFVGVVGRNAERLLNIVVDLLFMAQAQAGHLTLDRQPLDLSDLVDHAVEAALPAANERQITITAARCDDAIVRGDSQRLEQVLDNLLSNALKFTPRNGSVEVRLSASREEVVLEIADTGIGIPAGAQRELFTRFFRTDAAIAAAIQGTGLGLSIVKAIVDGHGGEVGVESAEGEGATFRVTLPRLASAAAA
jgi:signal transduction histidine kinase